MYRDDELAKFSEKKAKEEIFWHSEECTIRDLLVGFFLLIQTFKNVKLIMGDTKIDTGQKWPTGHRLPNSSCWDRTQGSCMLFKPSTTATSQPSLSNLRKSVHMGSSHVKLQTKESKYSYFQPYFNRSVIK